MLSLSPFFLLFFSVFFSFSFHEFLCLWTESCSEASVEGPEHYTNVLQYKIVYKEAPGAISRWLTRTSSVQGRTPPGVGKY